MFGRPVQTSDIVIAATLVVVLVALAREWRKRNRP